MTGGVVADVQPRRDALHAEVYLRLEAVGFVVGAHRDHHERAGVPLEQQRRPAPLANPLRRLAGKGNLERGRQAVESAAPPGNGSGGDTMKVPQTGGYLCGALRYEITR